MLTEELDRLNQMRNDGTLSESEFVKAKQTVLSGGSVGSGPGQICGMGQNTWIMLMHLSQLLTFAGGIGIAAPIVMWALGKDESREANRHGLMIINWFISALIYSVIGGILCFVVIGIPILVVLAVISVVFPIVGGIKAGNGEYWRYPLTIEFFSVDD
jgi:uncharacterized protein